MYEALGNFFHGQRDYKAAIHYHLRHLKVTKELGDRAGQRRALSHLGSAYYNLGNFKAAICYHESVLEIAKELKDRTGEGAAYCNLGIAYHSLGDLKRAIDSYECSLKIDKEVGSRAGEAKMYANLGSAYLHLRDLEKAIDYHEHHLKIVRELGDRDGEALAYFHFGNVYLRQGNFTKALEYHERSLKIAQKIGNRGLEGDANGNLGKDLTELGQPRKAILYLQRFLEIFEKLGNRAKVGQVYGKLGFCYHQLGEIKEAMNYYILHLNIAKEVGHRAEEGRAYGSLGNAYSSLGNFKEAIEYYELQLKLAQEVGDRDGEGTAYGSLGSAYHNLGDLVKAKDCLEHALKIAKEVGDKEGEGASYGNLGNVYQSSGDLENAIAYHELHLTNVKELQKRAKEGRAYANLANCYSSLRDFKKSIEYHLRSIQIAEEVGDKDSEARTYYNLGVCFKALGLLDVALHYVQSSVKILNDLRNRLQSKDEWKISLRHMYQTVYNSLWDLLLEQDKVVGALFAADQGRAQSLKDLLELKYRIDRPCDRSDSVEETVVDTLDCLPSNTVFLAVHGREIFYWVIQKEKEVEFKRQEIGDDSTVDATTYLQSLIENAREKLGVSVGVRCDDRSLDKLRNDMQSRERSGVTGSHSSEIQAGEEASASRKLYDVVIGPIENLIRGCNELTIVPDGPLCLAPYTAFVFLDFDSATSSFSAEEDNYKYLGESFRIRVLPSLSSWKLIASCPANHHCNSGALLVGDPWVQEVVDFEGKKLSQLPSAKEEVEIIGRIINYAPLTEREATKNEVLKRISSVALIHIAAHGSMETGEIALSPNPSRESLQPMEEDFLLTMTDVLSVELRARLVVLSCCHSGRGEIKAEGVVGIARAFLGAGARSVLVSLWAIDDEATLAFMRFFYEHLVKGNSASEALHKAMKAMRESDEFNVVKHWAPFVLIGDDVTLDFGVTE